MNNLKLMKILNENHKHEYGCVMLYFDFPEIKTLQEKIDKNDIYYDPEDASFGLENKPHTTLLFGLHPEVTNQNIQDVISKYRFSTCQISNPSLFENEEYDVLKFDVSGESLHECNLDLRKYPHTNRFPDYHPHLTIGYLKRETGKKYVKLIGNVEHNLTPKFVIYSKTDGSKIKFGINLK